MTDHKLTRLEVLERIRDAGRRDDAAAYRHLYVFNRVGLDAARNAWAEGRAEAIRAESSPAESAVA